MRKLALIFSFLFIVGFMFAQDIFPAKWEELNAIDFKKAVVKSEGVCVIPIGVIEKHGSHLPLGTDVFTTRYAAEMAAQKDYFVIFPFYYFGQIYEARQQPGTIAYSPDLLYKILEESCEEISRNGMKKIILLNGHGGNNFMLKYFAQTMLSKERDYMVYIFEYGETSKEFKEKVDKLLVSKVGGHADEEETSSVMISKPHLVTKENIALDNGSDLNRLNLENLYTSIWWYAKFPNHYSGDATYASKELGELQMNEYINQLLIAVKSAKEDTTSLQLQQEFFNESKKPLETKKR